MNHTVAARAWGSAVGLLGAALVARPSTAAQLATRGAGTPSAAIVRILGGRQLLQGIAVLARPDRTKLLIGGTIVDALHASSMVAAAVLWPRYRNAALASAGLAGTSAVIGAVIVRAARF